MLAKPFLPMMMWSCTEMPSGLAVSMIVLRHVDIGARGRRIAGRMVVDQDDRGRGEFQRPPDDFARIDGRVVDGSGLLDLVGDQRVLLVEEQDAELLALLEGHRRPAIVENLVPGRQKLPALDLATRHARGGRRDDLQVERDRGADALDLLQQRGRRAEHLSERAEPRQQRLGDGFGVARGGSAGKAAARAARSRQAHLGRHPANRSRRRSRWPR